MCIVKFYERILNSFRLQKSHLFHTFISYFAAVGIMFCSFIPPAKEVYFNVDRPFHYKIYETAAKEAAPLFEGRVTLPLP